MPRIARRPAHRREHGQVLVIVVFAMIAMLAMAGVIIDAGVAFAGQRETQNSTDAAALAGATIMVENLGGAPKTDVDVANAVATAAARAGVHVTSQVYVDWNHNVVGPVGTGGAIPSNAAGVRVQGTKQVGTYFSSVVGVDSLSTDASATALAGELNGPCSSDDGCGLLPLTFSVTMENCAVHNAFIQIGSAEWPLVGLDAAKAALASGSGLNEVILPLCKNGPGGYGWIDTGCGTLANSILHPCNTDVDVPTWMQTSTGNSNNVEDALNTYQNQVVLIPLFDGTCRSIPTSGLLADCNDPGNGNNLYYHIPMFTGFLLDKAYIQGNNHPECNSAPGGPFVGGNGSTGCLKGWFVRRILTGPVGPVGPGGPGVTSLGVQLVR